ncbi:DUF748 domain-containing protein, partial [Thermodesulfobacteriota bacterium]
KGQFALSMTSGKEGKLAIQGPITVQPMTANLEIRLEQLDVSSIQPYFSEKVKLIVTDGRFSAEGDVDVALKEDSSPTFRYQGKVWVSSFASVDKKEVNDFVKWESLYLSGVDIGLNPTKILIDEVALNGYYNQLTINPDGSININTILALGKADAEAQPDKEGKEEIKETKTELPEIRINTVNLQGGTIKFSDKLNKPNFETDLLQLGGRISGLSSDKEARADVFLKGVKDDSSPLEIKGKINPFGENLFADVKLSFRDIELSPFSPYSGKYLGYILEKGKLHLDLEYKVVGSQLQAKNIAYLDQLTLGDKVDSPEATSLPIKLGIALLKDRDDRIVLDLPVTGDLDDPEFSVGGIVLKMVMNMFAKIVTAPFAALGAMFGGGEELSYIEFETGSFDIDASAGEKLDTLAKALYDRPALDLEIQGEVNPEKDLEALRTLRFNNLVKAEKLKEMVKQGQDAPSVDQIELVPDEYEVYVKMAYEAAEFPKPRDAEGRIKKLPPSEMEKLLITSIEITNDDLRLLAYDRASNAKEYIHETGQIGSERMFIVEPQLAAAADEKGEKSSRVNFKLK